MVCKIRERVFNLQIWFVFSKKSILLEYIYVKIPQKEKISHKGGFIQHNTGLISEDGGTLLMIYLLIGQQVPLMYWYFPSCVCISVSMMSHDVLILSIDKSAQKLRVPLT